jgi:hypothetical protein
MTTLCKIENGVVTNRAHFAGAVPSGWMPDGETWLESDDAQIGWTYADGEFTAPPEPPASEPDAAAVNAERDRRIYPGPIVVTSVALTQPIPVDMRGQADRDNLSNLMSGAMVAKGAGVTTPIVNFGDADNNVTPLTADQVIALAMACLAYGSAVWQAARDLKDMSPIPDDFADDTHWPATAVTYPAA